MSEGKRSSQACHAASNSLIQFLKTHPSKLDEFFQLQHSGSRVTLRTAKLSHLLKAYQQAQDSGLACYLMSDTGHIHGEDFDGENSVVTALGIGPCTKEQARQIVKKFQVL